MQDYKTQLKPDHYYHIYNRANGDEQIFLRDDNYKYFLKKYLFYITPIADTLAYCLMPNHFHFLIRVKGEEELKDLSGFENLTGLEQSKKLSRQFSNLFNAYTKAFNKQNTRHGSLFSRSFNRKHINSEAYLKHTINYIHQNPIAHGYAKQLNEWQYSSYNSFFSEKPSQVCTKEVIELFGDKANFLTYHELEKAKNLAKIINFEF